MCIKIVFFSLFLIISNASIALNGMLGTAYNQVWKGKFCGMVSNSEIKSLTGNCKKERALRFEQTLPADFFEWSAFQQSAQNQIDKNNCMVDRIRSMMNDKNKLLFYQSVLAKSWLGSKKAELILKRCRNFEISSRKVQPDSVQNWKNLCENKSVLKALENAAEMMAYTLPVVGDKDLLKSMDSSRSFIRSQKTGQPITDDEILSLDLSNDQSLKNDVLMQTDDPGFEASNSKIKEYFTQVIDEREKLSQEISHSKSDTGYFNLDSSTKDLIYQDNTLEETFDSKNLNDSAGASCVLSKYEQSLGGSLLDFVATSAIAGGAVAKLALKSVTTISSSGQRLYKLMRSQSLTSKQVGAIMGPAIAGSIEMTHKTCVNQRKVKSEENLKSLNLSNSIQLMDVLNFTKRDLDKSKHPSCQKLESQNFYVNSEANSTCLLDAFLTLAPFKMVFKVGAAAGTAAMSGDSSR